MIGTLHAETNVKWWCEVSEESASNKNARISLDQSPAEAIMKLQGTVKNKKERTSHLHRSDSNAPGRICNSFSILLLLAEK